MNTTSNSKHKNNHEKNKEAELLLIEKLKLLGFTEIQLTREGKRKCLIINQNKRKITIYFNGKFKGDWQPSLKFADDCAPTESNNKYWIFIDVPGKEFYITPERWMAKQIYDDHQQYLLRHGGKRRYNNNSLHHRTTLGHIKKWKDAWNLLK